MTDEIASRHAQVVNYLTALKSSPTEWRRARRVELRCRRCRDLAEVMWTDVVVTSGRLAGALEHAGKGAGRFDDGGPDAGKPWLLGADDTLTEILDEHVAEMEQRDFDDLVEGLGPSRTLAGDAYDPQAVVAQHAAWTAAIRAAMG